MFLEQAAGAQFTRKARMQHHVHLHLSLFWHFSLEFLQTKSNKKIRACKCKTCPANSTTSWTVTASVVNKVFDLWCVQPKAIDKLSNKNQSMISKDCVVNTDFCCQCASNQVDPREWNSPDQMSFNFPVVRRMDFNACNANVNKVLVEQFEKQFNPDQNK